MKIFTGIYKWFFGEPDELGTDIPVISLVPPKEKLMTREEVKTEIIRDLKDYIDSVVEQKVCSKEVIDQVMRNLKSQTASSSDFVVIPKERREKARIVANLYRMREYMDSGYAKGIELERKYLRSKGIDIPTTVVDCNRIIDEFTGGS